MNGVQNLSPGAKVACPKCGRPGTVVISKFKAKGREYTYLCVLHKVQNSTRRCIISRWEGAKPVQNAEVQKAQIEVEELRRRVEELERENAQLRAQLLQLQQNVIARAGEAEREALFYVYVRKKGYTPEQLEVARSVMHALVSEDWVAVRAAAFFA